MTSKKQVEKQIEATLNSLDNVAPAEPAPFFYTRVMARLMAEEKNIWGKISMMVTRPAIAGFSIFLILIVNIFVIINRTSAGSAVPEQTEVAVADEYNRTTAFYNIDNVQP